MLGCPQITGFQILALTVGPANDGDKVRDVGGENTGEEDVIAPDNIHFEHVSIKLLLNN